MKKPAYNVRRITISAVFLSISLVLKTAFSFYVPMFGQNGLSIDISGVFSTMPSLLFGPAYGAAVSGLSDLLGYLLKPTGAYLPLMTLAVAFGGFVRGALWRALRNKSSRNMRIIVAACSVLLLVTGAMNIAFLAADGVDAGFYGRAQGAVQTDGMHLVSKMLITRTIDTKDPAGNLATYLPFVTIGLIGSAAFGLLLLAADLLISRKSPKGADRGRIPQLLIAMVSAGLIVTTINTVILRETVFASWKVLPFSVVWIPRVIEELLGNTVKAYFVALLLGVIQRQHFIRDLTDKAA